MNKFILGGILAAISLMAIYGTSASNRVISRVDGTGTSAQSNSGQPNNAGGPLALNSSEVDTADGQSPFVEEDPNGLTPLEQAGNLPQRQTVGASPDFGVASDPVDDTDGDIVEAPPAVETAPADDTAASTPPAATPAPEPIRALW